MNARLRPVVLNSRSYVGQARNTVNEIGRILREGARPRAPRKSPITQGVSKCRDN
jgi:hypothetical protein